MTFLAVAASGSSATNDTFFGRQWSLHNDGTQSVTVILDPLALHIDHQQGVPGVDIGWLEAQQELAGKNLSPVTVAVIDTGIDPLHPDLAGRISPDGYDFVDQRTKLSDDQGHGTHVSGIIAANTGNGIGIAGVTPSVVQVMPLLVLSKKLDLRPDANLFTYEYCPSGAQCTRRLLTDTVAEAINYAVAHHAAIINMSMGWPKLIDDASVREAIQNAVQAGVLVVVAAGNDRKNQPTYPCSYEGVLCVGSVTNTGAMAVYSNFGGMVDLLAPGDDILSLYPTETSSEDGTPIVPSKYLQISGYELLSGTSQAAPLVAGSAAVLKAAMPSITANEMKARLLLSAASLDGDSGSQALYGRVNLARALSLAPRPAYLPDFRALGDLVIHEGTLEISGALAVTNLWQASHGVKLSISINGKPASSSKKKDFASGERWTIPWKYKFASLDESSQPRMTLHISDGAGNSKDFVADLTVVRDASAVPSQQVLAVPSLPDGTTPKWLGTKLVTGQKVTTLEIVDAYPPESGLPRYFQNLGQKDDGISLLIYDPSMTSPIHALTVPGIKVLGQVIHIDTQQSGQRGWLITGTGQDASGAAYLEFYFLGADFAPLQGNASIWRLPFNADFWNGAKNANYAAAGSWVQLAGKLVPSFVGVGLLPDPDNYDALDDRSYQPARHLYYLAPGQPAAGATPLSVRAVDSADFRTQYGDVILEKEIPQSSADQGAGHVRMLLAIGDGLLAKTRFLDLRSVNQAAVTDAAGWDAITASGAVVQTRFHEGSAWVNLFDTHRGNIVWVGTDGALQGHDEFSYENSVDALETLVGAFDLGDAGHFWFFESGFDLIAYRSARSLEMQTLSVERESSFPTTAFNELFSPVLIGGATHPLPGVYVDSTDVRGNRVSVALWNASQRFLKPIRYSLEIPDGCLQMPKPVQLSGSAPSFALPVLCKAASGLEFRIVQP